MISKSSYFKVQSNIFRMKWLLKDVVCRLLHKISVTAAQIIACVNDDRSIEDAIVLQWLRNRGIGNRNVYRI